MVFLLHGHYTVKWRLMLVKTIVLLFFWLKNIIYPKYSHICKILKYKHNLICRNEEPWFSTKLKQLRHPVVTRCKLFSTSFGMLTSSSNEVKVPLWPQSRSLQNIKLDFFSHHVFFLVMIIQSAASCKENFTALGSENL